MPDISVDAKKALAAFEQMGPNVDLAVRLATSRVAAEAESKIKNKIQPVYNDGHKRADGRTTDARVGGPPMTRSGELRASIISNVTRKGFGSYTAIIGPTIIYGRAVELGAPNWKTGVRYPYITPAMRELSQSGRLRDIYVNAMNAAI
jgi:hypothetical protein